jgi:glycine betaine catabolism A
VTMWPSAYIVAHVDYVRSVRLQPLSPTRTRLTAKWYSPSETLAQRGIASPAFRRGTLMPEEYEIHRFEEWVLQEMEMRP